MTATHNNQYRLSIQFSLNGFSFLVYNTQTEEIITEKEILYTQKSLFYDWLKVQLAKEEAFRKTYTAVNVLFCPEKTTVVPNALINKKSNKDIFSIAHPLANTEMIFTENCENATILSAINSDIYNLLKDYFPKLKWTTLPALLLANKNTMAEWTVNIALLENSLFIIVKEDKKLHLCNSFAFQTRDDLLYYILYTFDNLDIPVPQSSIKLFGKQSYMELLANELGRYHSNINLPEKKGNLPLSNLLLLNI